MGAITGALASATASAAVIGVIFFTLWMINAALRILLGGSLIGERRKPDAAEQH